MTGSNVRGQQVGETKSCRGKRCRILVIKDDREMGNQIRKEDTRLYNVAVFAGTTTAVLCPIINGGVLIFDFLHQA
jgi:hypothetical protein